MTSLVKRVNKLLMTESCGSILLRYFLLLLHRLGVDWGCGPMALEITGSSRICGQYRIRHRSILILTGCLSSIILSLELLEHPIHRLAGFLCRLKKLAVPHSPDNVAGKDSCLQKKAKRRNHDR
jgi:hypothetical protein